MVAAPLRCGACQRTVDIDRQLPAKEKPDRATRKTKRARQTGGASDPAADDKHDSMVVHECQPQSAFRRLVATTAASAPRTINAGVPTHGATKRLIPPAAAGVAV